MDRHQSGYYLNCTGGETQGDKIPVRKNDLRIVSGFLRAQLNWQLASANDDIDYTPHQPVFVGYMTARGEMRDAGIFNKWQARSTWTLEETMVGEDA